MLCWSGGRGYVREVNPVDQFINHHYHQQPNISFMLVWSGGRGYVREVTLSDYLSDYPGLPLPPHRAGANHNIGITL